MLEFLKNRVDLFVIIALCALLQLGAYHGLTWVSYLDIPLSMIRTYFHEMSHGIAALLTGGHFYQVELAFGQGGVAHTFGGRMFSDKITVFCGYLGPSVWGLLIYLTFTRWLRDRFDLVPYICMGIAGASLVLLARDIRTIGIIVFIMAVFQSIGRMESDRQMYWAVKFLSLYLIMGGAIDPYLFYYHPENQPPEWRLIWDGQVLEDLTSHKQLFWVHIWMACSAASFLILLIMEWTFEFDDSIEWSGKAENE